MVKKKAAILQHDDDSAQLSKLLLESVGYEIQIVDRTSDPIEAIKAYSPDVLLMDLRPLLDYSWRLLERLAENANTVQLPIVAIATLEKDALRAQMHTNVAEVLLAPFDIEELVGKVGAAIKTTHGRGCSQGREAMGA